MHERSSHHSPYYISRCQNGCLHLVFGNVTLHLSEDEFLILSSIVATAREKLVVQRETEHNETNVATHDTFVM